jgi:hypothetical protein
MATTDQLLSWRGRELRDRDETDTVTEEREVSEEVRRERIDVDGDTRD